MDCLMIQNQKRKPHNPDRLLLEKKDILDFCDRVLERWQNEPLTSNMTKNIAAMMGVRTAVYFTDDESLKAIWSEIIQWAYQSLHENSTSQRGAKKSEWTRTRGKSKKK